MRETAALKVTAAARTVTLRQCSPALTQICCLESPGEFLKAPCPDTIPGEGNQSLGMELILFFKNRVYKPQVTNEQPG
jgi:hypothetical protein